MHVEALSSEYLVITGAFINDMVLTRKSWVLPGQRCTRISLSPVNYTFQVEAMSAEKLPFILPVVFTVGPRADDPDSLLKYARLVLSSSHDSTMSTRVTRLVDGETRALAASMPMEEIVKDTRHFMRQVFHKVHIELAQLGLHVHNANVKQPVGEKVGPKLTRQIAAKFDVETKNLSTALTATEKFKAMKVAYLGQKQKEAEAEAEYKRKKKVEGELRWRDTSTLRRRKPSSSPLYGGVFQDLAKS